jgi:hypothetical protein
MANKYMWANPHPVSPPEANLGDKNPNTHIKSSVSTGKIILLHKDEWTQEMCEERKRSHFLTPMSSPVAMSVLPQNVSEKVTPC